MSLAALAIRLATVRALRGATFAEDRVFDSKIDPIHLAARAEASPVIVVSTDDDDLQITGRDLFSGDHRQELVIEVAVASRVTVEIGEGEQVEQVAIPASDAGLEATLGLIGWQITKALAADGGEWGDLWRRLVMKVHSVVSRRGADDESGVRYAVRQYIYTLDHIAEPAPGDLGAGLWADLLAKAKLDTEIAPLARIIEAEIEQGDYLPWEVARGQLGLANDEAEIIASKPVKIDEIVPLASIEMPGGRLVGEDGA